MVKYRCLSYCFLVFILGLGVFMFSCKPVKLSDADRHFKNGEYFEAASMYRKLYRKTPTKNRELRGRIAYRQAESFRLINNVALANAAYVNAIRYNPTDSLIRLQYARTLHKDGK